MPRRALKSERGLATSEYAGILAIVAAIFLAVFALGLDGKIGSTVETALCRILGGDCGTTTAQTP
jgi:Flp pilus assembly pilin Flp